MELHDSLLRCYAYHTGKSVRSRATAAVTRQLPALGRVPIRIAGGQRIQAIAVGALDASPTIETFCDPYRPRGEDFAGVSAELFDLWVRHPWQLWTPDESARRTWGLEGIRNRRNPAAPSFRRTFAEFCHALYLEAERPGQQVVVVATELLARHLTTGQSPTEDTHLGARLAWDNPGRDEHPGRVAEARRLLGDMTLLSSQDDEAIEAIRARAAKGTPPSAELRWIDHVLHDAALQAWQVLQEAHQVYQQLDVPDLPGLAVLTDQSLKDFKWLLSVSPDFGATRKGTLLEFRTRQYLQEVCEDLNARGDRVVRERLRQEGRVIAATVRRVTPASKKRGRPCWLLLSTAQAMRRCRVGTQLKTQDTAVTGRIEGIRNTTEGVLLLLRVTRGVTAARALSVSSHQDWFDTVVFNSAPWMRGGRNDAP